MLTICYITNRKEPQVEWFLNSLKTQSFKLGESLIQVVIVSIHELSIDKSAYPFQIIVTPPKPTVWQGQHRLTKEDYFAASNARNTGLCCARGRYIAYVDDLSVLMPGWLKSVIENLSHGFVALGAYKKVKNLTVDKVGDVVSYEEFPAGLDSRWNHGDNGPVDAAGSWLFGCSLALPTEALLDINGWPEHCDGMGSEDYITGIVLQNNGYKFKYDRRMLTLESEELHHLDKPMKRIDKGVSPNDKSHAVLNLAYQQKRFENYFGPDGIAGLRKKILNGEKFPIMCIPEHDWFDGQPLREM